MNILDVNVLVALHRPETAQHGAARQWWEGTVVAGVPFVVPDVSWSGFLRVTTNPRIYQEATALTDAWAFVRTMSAHRLCLKHVPGPDTLTYFETAASQAQMVGPDLCDAYVAALAMEYGATVVTFDRDFRKFDNLRLLELA